MDFYERVDQVAELLRHRRRVTYRSLKEQFDLDEDVLESLKEELFFSHPEIIDEAGRGLVWTGEATRPSAFASPPSQTTQQPIVHVAQPAQADAPSSEPPPHGAERRQLTVMFCDLVGSTELSGRLDPEELRDVIRAYQSTSTEVIARYDGYIAQHLGDGLMVYFGWPQAHEDDAHRALYAGLGIIADITATLNPRLEAEKGIQLTVRLGVHTGPVVVGEMGSGGRHENLATGETVNIASRLEGLATPNTVVLSAATARLVRGTFALEDLGLHTLKGVAEPMPVFRVLSLLDTYEDETRVAGVPFLVGRDEEMGLLLRRWEQSKEGLGQVALISGEAGIGKSSLAATVRHHVVQQGYTRITFRCSPYHTNSALYPVIDHVQRVLQFQPGDTPETRLDKLERVLNGYSRPLEEVVPLYAALLSVPVPEGRYADLNLSPQQQRQQTQDALVGWMLEEAERQPTLAMWEDVHWADPSTLEMLGLVLEQTPTVPMLHVLTYRPEFESPWPTRSHMTPITLNRLERPQVEAMITHLAGGKTLPDEVVQHIVAKTDGVPLYVEELTKMLLESDLLREEADHYALTGPLLSLAIPDTLQDSLMARLDQLNTAKEVAQLGAVLGREFAYDMLQAISSQDEELLQTGLARLVEAELLYQRGRLPRARYIFKHALIQDAAYASLLRSTRQQVHQQVAQLLERQFPDTVVTQPELVAHHYTEAGQTTEAIRYWQQAGRRANERSSQDEAMAHLTTGLGLVRQLPEAPARLEQELQLSIALGSSLMVAKGYAAPEVEAVYTRARALCQQLGDTPHLFTVLAGMVAFYLTRGAQPTARELAEQGLALAEREQRPSRLVWAHSLLGAVLSLQGELVPARQHLEHGMTLYSPRMHRAHLPTQDPGVNCLGYAAVTLGLLGYADQALARAEAAHDLAQELAHPFSAVWARTFSTRVHMLRGNIQTAAEQADAMLGLATEQGFTLLMAQAMIPRGWIWAMQGQVEEGLRHMRQGLEAYQAMGARVDQPLYLALLAEVYGHAHQPEAGLRVATEALALVEQQGERYYEAELHRLKGELLLIADCGLRIADCTPEDCFHQALAVARHQQAKSWELRAAMSLARLWQSQDKRQDACDLLAPVYGWFTEGFDTADLIEAKQLVDELSAEMRPPTA